MFQIIFSLIHMLYGILMYLSQNIRAAIYEKLKLNRSKFIFSFEIN